MSQHARLSPSNHRWPHCPGSVREEAQYPDVSGDAAIDGTGSHLLLELTIHIGTANKFLGCIIGEGHPERPQGWKVEQDRIDRVNIAHGYIQRRIKELGGASVESESKSNPGKLFGRDDWEGTCDITLGGVGTPSIEVIDYKDGQMYVSEQDNPQLIGYAAGKIPTDWVYANYKDVPVRMTVIQPKTSKPIRYQDTTVGELLKKAGKLAEAAKLTDDPNAPLIPGSHCTWCKHGRSGNCPANNQTALEGLEIMTQNNSGQNTMIEAIKSGQLSVAEMPGSQLAAVMDAAGPIKKMIEQVEAEAMKRLQDNPASIPGFEIGSGRKKRVWSDEEEVVAKKLKGMRFKKDEVYPASLITPAAALKHPDISDRQRANLEAMVKEEPGSPKVVKSAATVEVLPADQMFMGIEQKEAAPAPPEIPSFM